DSVRSDQACTGIVRSDGRDTRTGKGSSQQPAGSAPETSPDAPPARCEPTPTPSVRATPRARGGPTLAVRRETALHGERARSRQSVDRSRRPPTPPLMRYGAALYTVACPSRWARILPPATGRPRSRALRPPASAVPAPRGAVQASICQSPADRTSTSCVRLLR